MTTTKRAAILQAVARGWCHEANSAKEMDSDLAEAITAEVCASLAEQSAEEVPTGCPYPRKCQFHGCVGECQATTPAEQAVPVACRTDGMPASANERHLRRLLAYRTGILGAYYDDGEAQGQEHGISIDFMREPVAEIDAKLRALNVARASFAAPPAPAATEQAEPVAVPASIVAGAIFDFAGFLTTHKCVIKVGSTANASPVVERIKEWAGLRGLPIDDADVLSWQKNTAPPAPARQEWQPIETAPKTGAKIIVRYVNRNNKPRTVMARWLTDEQAEETDADGVGLKGGWYECIDNWDDYTEVAIHEGEPSLWMPLPAAPITAAPAEGDKQ